MTSPDRRLRYNGRHEVLIDFMFTLTPEEKAKVVADCDHLRSLRFSPTLPNAFTEHGAVMLASVLVTDVGILKPLPGSGELAWAEAYPGIGFEDARAAVGWPLARWPETTTCAAPTTAELRALRALEARTAAAHREPVRLPV